jgi:hypothetical protein
MPFDELSRSDGVARGDPVIDCLKGVIMSIEPLRSLAVKDR